MVPASFQAFFSASAGAGATLVGLLFVAVSIAPDRVFGQQAHQEHQLVASAAFTALSNGLFISLAALMPNAAIGVTVCIMAGVALMNSLALGRHLFRRSPSPALFRAASLVAAGLIIYSFELWDAIQLLQMPADSGPIYVLAGVLVGIYGFGIIRAWELIGANRPGLVNFLIPLIARARQGDAHSADDSSPAPAPAAEPVESAHPRQ